MLQKIENANPPYYFSAARRKLAVKDESPATSPPMKPVMSIKATGLAPMPNSTPILADSMLSFAWSIHQERIVHRRKTPRKPARKAFQEDSLTNKATMKAAMAILHQGKYNPNMKASRAVSRKATRNFIF